MPNVKKKNNWRPLALTFGNTQFKSSSLFFLFFFFLWHSRKFSASTILKMPAQIGKAKPLKGATQVFSGASEQTRGPNSRNAPFDALLSHVYTNPRVFSLLSPAYGSRPIEAVRTNLQPSFRSEMVTVFCSSLTCQLLKRDFNSCIWKFSRFFSRP